MLSIKACIFCHFNPRSREGSDKAPREKWFSDGISIHAPARGATRMSKKIKCCDCISIHAPARGATLGLQHIFAGLWISIHAPARGAT